MPSAFIGTLFLNTPNDETGTFVRAGYGTFHSTIASCFSMQLLHTAPTIPTAAAFMAYVF